MKRRTTRNPNQLTIVKTIGGYQAVDRDNHSVVAKKFNDLRSAWAWLNPVLKAGKRVSCVDSSSVFADLTFLGEGRYSLPEGYQLKNPLLQALILEGGFKITAEDFSSYPGDQHPQLVVEFRRTL
jgi:hypothetical protein